MKLLVKILSGPHVGAEVLLRAGECVIGQADECDLILNDAAVAAKHLKLIVAGDSVRVSALEGPVLLQGRPLQGDRVPLSAFQVLTLGGTHLCVGPADQEWPRLSLPDLVKSGADAAGPPATEKQPEPSKAAHGEGGDDKGKASAAPKGTAAPAKASAGTFGGKRRLVPLIAVLMLCLAAAALLWVGRNMWRASAPAREAQDVEVAARLQAKGIRCWVAVGKDQTPGSQRGLARRGLRVTAGADGQVAVYGVVPDEAGRSKVAEALKGLPYAVSTELKTVGEAVAQASRLLAERKASWRVDPEGVSAIRVQGFARDNAVREAVAAPLNAILPGALDIRWSIVSWDLLEPHLNRALGKHGLRRLAPRPSDTRVDVEGSITPEEAKAWDALRRDVDNALGVSITFNGPTIAVKTPEEIVAQARKLLEERKVFWRVDWAGGNKVRVQGFARDDTVREAAAAPLSAVLSGAPDVKWNIVSWGRLKPVLDGALGKHGLDRLVAKPLETRVAVEGSITPAEVKAWDALRKEISDALGASIEFNGPDVAAPTPPPTPAPAEEEPPQPALPDVAAVNLTHPRRFLSSDGKWHEEGTTLDCGFTVREVFAKGVVLTRDRELVIVPLKEKGP